MDIARLLAIAVLLSAAFNTQPAANIAIRAWGKQQHSAEEGKSNHTEWRHRLKNGEIRDVEVFSSALAYQGKVVLYSIMHDVTARKQVEHALQESKLRLKFALEGAGGEAAVDFGHPRCSRHSMALPSRPKRSNR